MQVIQNHAENVIAAELEMPLMKNGSIKKIKNENKKNNSKIFDYLTFLNLGVLKNIILRLKNNIEIVRAGKI